MEFPIFHKYMRLARRGMCRQLVCRHCNTELVLQIGEKDEPVLMCFGCNTLTLPGLAMYNRLRAVVMEHHV